MSDIDYAFLVLRIGLLENIFLQDKSAKSSYIEALTVIREVINNRNENGSVEMISLIDEHLNTLNETPT